MWLCDGDGNNNDNDKISGRGGGYGEYWLGFFGKKKREKKSIKRIKGFTYEGEIYVICL